MKTCPVCDRPYGDEKLHCSEDGGFLRFEPGSVIGRGGGKDYEITAVIGAGGMGVVYAARQLNLDKRRAIKVLSVQGQDAQKALRMLHAEAKVMARLEHPHIVQIHDIDTTEQGHPFVVMEFVDGKSLSHRLQMSGCLPIDVALRFTAETCSALAAAHQVVRLHRDIKPQNLLLAKGPHGRESIKVIDFGIAKVREDAGLGFTGIIGNTTGMVVGTPMYASPEQLEARGDIDRRSDLYSLGVVLYEMLTGKLPPPESIQEARPELYFPATLSALVTKALARDRERRFQTAEQMENEVLAHLAGAHTLSAGAGRGGDRLARPMAETEVRAPSNPGPKVNPADGLTYVWIPPGSFMMGGSPGDSECDSDEMPARPITIEKGFWLCRTPVTQAAFEKVMGKNPSRVKGPRRPVESVTWEEARTYCEKAGGRLPTEAEWEYAARGNEPGARYGNPGKIAWYSGNSGAQTHEVGKMEPNKFGLYDMLGNVWEWTADWYEADWLERDKYRSVRGASCFDDPGFVRVSKRYKVEPGGRYGYLGFRCIT